MAEPEQTAPNPTPPPGSGLTTLAPRQGDSMPKSLIKINAILFVAGGP